MADGSVLLLRWKLSFVVFSASNFLKPAVESMSQNHHVRTERAGDIRHSAQCPSPSRSAQLLSKFLILCSVELLFLSAERLRSSRRALNWLVWVQQLLLGNTEFHNFFSRVCVFALVHKLWLMVETWSRGTKPIWLEAFALLSSCTGVRMNPSGPGMCL